MGKPNFRDFVIDLCRSHGFEPQIAQEVGDGVTGVALVASGFGVCIVPESVTYFRAAGVTYLPIEESPPIMLDVSCLVRRDDDSAIVREFMNILGAFRVENGISDILSKVRREAALSKRPAK